MKLIIIAPILVVVVSYICSMYLYLIIKLVAENTPKRMLILMSLIWITLPFGLVFELIRRIFEKDSKHSFLFRLTLPIFGLFITVYLLTFKASSSLNKISTISIEAIQEAHERRSRSEKTVLTNNRPHNSISVVTVSFMSIKQLLVSILNIFENHQSQSFSRTH